MHPQIRILCKRDINPKGKKIITDIFAYVIWSEKQLEKLNKVRKEFETLNGVHYDVIDLTPSELLSQVTDELKATAKNIVNEYETKRVLSHNFYYNEPDLFGKFLRKVFKVKGWADLESSWYFVILIFVIIVLIAIFYRPLDY